MNQYEEARLIDRIEALEKENAELKEQLRRCFKGETTSVRSEIITRAIKKETERVLALPQEDIREYLSRKFD